MDDRDVKRATEPLQFKAVGGPEDYGDTGDSTIRYVVVANSAGILGYLWAADDHDSAGYVPRRAEEAGGMGMNDAVASGSA
jgi:hypothetical protein